MKNKSEAIVVRRSGGKIIEFKIVPHGQQNATQFATDNVVRGSMTTVSLEKFDSLVQWLQQNGKLEEATQMVKHILLHG